MIFLNILYFIYMKQTKKIKKDGINSNYLILHSGWKDFEDSVQYHCAKANPFISGIITRNVKDFQQSDIEILDSLTFNYNQ